MKFVYFLKKVFKSFKKDGKVNVVLNFVFITREHTHIVPFK